MKKINILLLIVFTLSLCNCITYPKNDFPVYNPAKIDKKISGINFVLSYKPSDVFGRPLKLNQNVHLANRQAFTQIISNCNCIKNFNLYIDGYDDLSELNDKNLVRIEISSKPILNAKFLSSTVLFAISVFLFPSIGDIYTKTEFIAYNQGKEIKRYTYENEIVEVRGLLIIFVKPFINNNYVTNLNVPDNFLNDIYRDKIYPMELK
jgi:hypothetical protein